MKKALMVLAAVALSSSAFAQGTLIFSNRNVPDPSGNQFNIPIWAQGGTGTDGAGDLPGGVRASLYLSSDLANALATTLLRNTTSTEFFATSSQNITFPAGNPAGSTPQLTLRIWQGEALSFAVAQASGVNQFAEVTFTSYRLGGTPPGGDPLTPVGMNIPGGTGITLVPEPSTMALGMLGLGALMLRRRK